MKLIPDDASIFSLIVASSLSIGAIAGSIWATVQTYGWLENRRKQPQSQRIPVRRLLLSYIASIAGVSYFTTKFLIQPFGPKLLALNGPENKFPITIVVIVFTGVAFWFIGQVLKKG